MLFAIGYTKSFYPPNNSDIIPQIIWHIQEIEYLSVSSQLLAKIYKINKLKELKVLVINQGNFKVPDNFILNNLELISTEGELFSPNELPFSQSYTMQV